MAGLPNPYEKGLTPNNAWDRMQFSRYGGQDPNTIIPYRQQKEGLMNRTLGAGLRSRGGGGGGGTNWLGSGSVNTSYGGGNTPSNPGGYNYGTLGRSVGNVAETVNWAFNTRNKLRKNQEQQDRIRALKNARDQKKQDLPMNDSSIKAMTTFKNVTNPGGTNAKSGDASGMLAPSNADGPPFTEGNSPWFDQAMERLNFDPTAKTRAGHERSWQNFAGNQDLANNTPSTRNMPNRSGKFPHVSTILGKKQP